jgi:hypothetical protein
MINCDHIISKHHQDSLPEERLNSILQEYFVIGHFVVINGCLSYHRYQHLHFKMNNETFKSEHIFWINYSDLWTQYLQII